MDVIHPGIPGALNQWFPNQGQARRAALRVATQRGPDHTIAHDPRPTRGLPHYHVVDPNSRRVSGHFFYGRRPPRRVLRGRPWREVGAAEEFEFEQHIEQADATTDSGTTADYLSEHWAAWNALPLPIRDWLVWIVPGWWSLPAAVFRRLLLTTASLVVWDGLPPRVALRRAAMQLRLPPPRPMRSAARIVPRNAVRPIWRQARQPTSIRLPGRRSAPIRPLRVPPMVSRPRVTPSFRRSSGVRRRFR